MLAAITTFIFLFVADFSVSATADVGSTVIKDGISDIDVAAGAA